MNPQCRGCQQQLMWGDIIKKLKSKDKEAQKRAGRQPLQPLDPNASAPTKTATKAPTQKTVTKTSDTQTKVATKRKKADTENVPSPSLDDHKPKKTSNTKQRSTTTTTTQNTKLQTSTIPDYFNAYNSDSDIIDMTKLTNSIPSPKISKNSKPKSTTTMTTTTTTRTIPIVPTTTTTTTTKPSEPKPMYSSKRKKFEVGELDELYSDDESKPKSTARGKAKASVKNACIDLI